MQFRGALIAALFIVGIVLYVGFLLIWLRSTRRAPGSGRVLVVRSSRGTSVFRHPTFVLPFLHSAVELDLGDRRVEFDLTDPPLAWGDGTSTCCRGVVTIGIPDDDERILALSRGIGCARGSDDTLLSALFGVPFARALREVAATMAPPRGRAADELEAGVRARVEKRIHPFEVRSVALLRVGQEAGDTQGSAGTSSP